jgi:hypothetical protein
MNISENAASSWITRIMAAFSSRMIAHSVIVATVAMRRVSPRYARRGGVPRFEIAPTGLATAGSE